MPPPRLVPTLVHSSGGGFFDTTNEYIGFAWQVLLPISFAVQITNKFVIPFVLQWISSNGGSASPFDGI